MKRSARMEKVADINLGFENIAGATLASARTHHQLQEKQLEQLKVYKEEYREQLKTRLKNTISVNQIQDYQYFFSSLDKAISQQIEIVKQSASQVEMSKNNWLNKKQDVSKISQVAANLKSQEDFKQREQEQKSSDELNQLLFNMNKH